MWQKNLNQGCQNCILCLQKNVSMSFLGEKVSLHHSRFIFAKKHTKFERKTIAFVLKMQSACPGEQFEGKQILERTKFFINFVPWAGKFHIFGKQKSAGFSTLHYTCPDERFEDLLPEKKNIFSLSPPDFEQTTMRLFAGRNQHGLQNCILRLQRNILRIFLINASFLFITFRLLPQKKSNFWRQKCGILAKMQSGWPPEYFEKKTTFLKVILTYICPSWSFSNFQPIFFKHKQN